MYDIIVIGGGPAGMSAAIYARRSGRSVLVIERAAFGGQMATSPRVENYPGFSSVSGAELADRMLEQAAALGAELELGEATGIEPGAIKTVHTDDGDFQARAVIVAAGVKHRRLGLPGEEELTGNGVSFCAVCDGAFYAGRTAAVVGGGNSAVQEALLLAQSCEYVVLCHRRELTAERSLLDALEAQENVSVMNYVRPTGFLRAEDGALRGVSAAVVVQIERAAGTEQYAIRLGGTSDAVYLACRSNSEQLNTAEDTGTSLSRWVISMEDGHMTIRSARYLSRTLQYDADAGCFRCYAKTKTPLTVYRGETSSLWYTTQPKMHDHQLVETGRREPTCTMSGWIDFRCTICGELRRQPLEPLGHEVVNGLCVRCGEVMQLPFRDVPEDAYYYDAVVWGLFRGVVNGTTMTTFSPDLSCTRAQAVTFLWRAAGSPEPTASEMTFTDVKADSYYYKAVLWAVENKITSGMSDTLFAPDATCSRSQIVTFLYRMQNSPESKAENPFTDVKADAYYANAVLWAVENGVTTGASATTFDPAGDCTRGQIVTFLYRCLSK